MCEHTGGVLRDFVLVFRGDICREHSLIRRRNCLMTEAANSLSAAADPELSKTRNAIANLAFGHGRTRLDSGLRAVAPRCLGGENVGRTMIVLHHALCGDDFHQSPVSILFRRKCLKFFWWFCGRCNTGGAAYDSSCHARVAQPLLFLALELLALESGIEKHHPLTFFTSAL